MILIRLSVLFMAAVLLTTQAASGQDGKPKAAPSFSIDAKKELLAAELKRENILKDGLLTQLELIDPSGKYPVVQFDDSGKPLDKLTEVSGTKLRDSIVLLKAYASKKILDDKSTKALNKALYDDEKGPGDDKDKKAAARAKLLDALNTMRGNEAANLPPSTKKEEK